jgi:hypothetical protein
LAALSPALAFSGSAGAGAPAWSRVAGSTRLSSDVPSDVAAAFCGAFAGAFSAVFS